MSQPEKIDRDEAENIVRGLIDNACAYIDEEVSPRRALATQYYRGEPFGNEEDGRSKVVMHAVRTAVKKMLPSLLRIFYGSERAVEFIARTEGDVPLAEQRNDLMEYVLTVENEGFRVFHSWFKDALVKRLGIVKWWWEEETVIEREEYCGLSAAQVAGTKLEYYVRPDAECEFEEEQNQDGTIDLTITCKYESGKVRFDALPPEEFLYLRGSRSATESLMVGHRTKKSIGDLIAMGFDADEFSDVGEFASTALDESDEEITRNPDRTGTTNDTSGPVPFTAREVEFVEAYTKIDEDGDGIPELRLYRFIGPSWKMIGDSEIVTCVPFAVLCPDPEPHTIEGMSVSDDVMDLQLVQSNILRGILDSLNLTLNPATEVVAGEVNLQDAANTEIGKLIRVKRPGMIREVAHTFVGGQALPVLQYFDFLREERTGLPDAAAGLDADALQSSTAGAVNATVTGAQQQIEMVARIFAETGVKQLFRGLSILLAKHQQRAKTIRLRDTFVEVAPTVWQSDMDLRVNVALGTGLVETKIAVLNQAVQQQLGIMQLAGPQNPLAGLRELAYTLRKQMELAGFKNATDFFKMPTEEDLQPPPPPPDPNMILLQIEQSKAQTAQQKVEMEAQAKMAELQLRERELQVEQEKIAQEAQLKEQEMLLEFELKKAEIEAKFQFEVEVERAKWAFEERRLMAESENKREEMLMQADTQIQIAERQAQATEAVARRKEFTIKRDPKTGRPVGGTVSVSGE